MIFFYFFCKIKFNMIYNKKNEIFNDFLNVFCDYFTLYKIQNNHKN